MPAQISDIGEAIAALTGLGPDQLILLIILAEIVIVGGALWILNKVIQAMHASAEVMRQKVEADVVQTARIGEMSSAIAGLSRNVAQSVENESKRLDIALQTLTAVKETHESVRAVSASVKEIDASLDDLRKFIEENGMQNTERVLQSVNALFKRFNDAEESARSSMQQAMSAGVRIKEAVEDAKQSIISALMRAGIGDKQDDNRNDSTGADLQSRSTADLTCSSAFPRDDRSG